MFITFEGTEAAGKSTQIRKIAERLTAEGHHVILTREPGGSPGAEEIRRLILEGDKDKWSDEVELLLFNAARRDHVEKTVRPSLEKGMIVLCDRYVDTTYAYQGMKSPESLERAIAMHEMMIGLEPDLTILVDISREESERRLAGRPEESNRMEDKGSEFHAAAIKAFRALAETRLAMVAVDGAGNPDAVTERILDVIQQRLAPATEPGIA